MAFKGKPKSGGRTKGTKNKRTLEMLEATKDTGESPLDYMKRVFRDDNIPKEIQDLKQELTMNTDIEQMFVVAQKLEERFKAWYQRRDKMAEASAPYMHARLQTTTHQNPDGSGVFTGCKVILAGAK